MKRVFLRSLLLVSVGRLSFGLLDAVGLNLLILMLLLCVGRLGLGIVDALCLHVLILATAAPSIRG